MALIFLRRSRVAASFFQSASVFVTIAIDKDRFTNPVKAFCHQPKTEHDRDEPKKGEQRFSPGQGQYAGNHIANSERLAAILPVHPCAAGGECINLVTDNKEGEQEEQLKK